jgi:hypothetical protein
MLRDVILNNAGLVCQLSQQVLLCRRATLPQVAGSILFALLVGGLQLRFLPLFSQLLGSVMSWAR